MQGQKLFEIPTMKNKKKQNLTCKEQHFVKENIENLLEYS